MAPVFSPGDLVRFDSKGDDDVPIYSEPYRGEEPVAYVFDGDIALYLETVPNNSFRSFGLKGYGVILYQGKIYSVHHGYIKHLKKGK